MVKDTLSAFLDILFPRACHICSKDIKNKASAFDDHICSACADQMDQTPVVSCSLCGDRLTEEDELKSLHCRVCANDIPAYQKLLACYVYGGTTKELIHIFKYGNRPYLAKTIGRLMLKALDETGKSIIKRADAIVPVPLHPTRQREREFNQSELIAKELCTALHKPLLPALKKTRHTRPQVSLEKNNRLKNLSGAFGVCEPSYIKNKRLLLIDDVVTTAATVKEAAYALKKSGALSISVLAFAKG